jgi:hypothetical protein
LLPFIVDTMCALLHSSAVCCGGYRFGYRTIRIICACECAGSLSAAGVGAGWVALGSEIKDIKAADLVQAGIVVGNGQGQGGIRYQFTGLNALKPDMITEATRNARASADRFAADSGGQVSRFVRRTRECFRSRRRTACQAEMRVVEGEMRMRA